MNLPSIKRNWLVPHAFLGLRHWEMIGVALLNLLVFSLLSVFLFPTLYMLATSFMEQRQLGDRYAPAYPAEQLKIDYEGKQRFIYHVPFENGTRQLALVKPGRTSSGFVDPQDPSQEIITWEGSWRLLEGVYRFHLTWDNYTTLFRVLKFPQLIRNTLLMAIISGIGVLTSSVIVAYGFARFPLPGGDLIFYIMIATILIPEKVTLIPTYFFFQQVLDWGGSWLPILVPFFFGNAVYIFLLRQNFKSIPKEMEEAAVLDGAGPLRTLFSVVLPQSWPVMTTVTLLHFFFMWNESRQASLYLSTRRDLVPVSFGIANFQTLAPIQNQLQASALVIMIVPVVVLLISQRFFLRNMIITGMEK